MNEEIEPQTYEFECSFLSYTFGLEAERRTIWNFAISAKTKHHRSRPLAKVPVTSRRIEKLKFYRCAIGIVVEKLFVNPDFFVVLVLMQIIRQQQAEVESSRTHFEVLGLGLEASSPRKLACPRLEDSSIFWIVKISWSAWKIFWKTFFCGDRLKNFCEDLFFFFFWRALALVSLVLGLGLEHSCPWPRECLSSERLSLALASDFFCVLGLGLEPCVLDSTSGNKHCELSNAALSLLRHSSDCKFHTFKFHSWFEFHTWNSFPLSFLHLFQIVRKLRFRNLTEISICMKQY